MAEDYRVTRGKALIAEKKRAAKNPQKGVGLPSRANVANAVGTLATVVGPGKYLKGARLARRLVGGSKTASRLQKASGNPIHASKMKTKQEVAQLAKNTKAMQDRATAALESGKYKKVGAAKPSRKTVETPKPAKKSTTAAVGANIRKAKAGVVKPTRVSSAQAAKAARDVGKAPVPRNRPALKAGADRKTGLSPSEFKQKSKVDTITRPKPRQPRSQTQISKDKKDINNAKIRNVLTPRKPIGEKRPGQVTNNRLKVKQYELPKHKVDLTLYKRVGAGEDKVKITKTRKVVRGDLANKVKGQPTGFKNWSEAKQQRYVERKELRRDIAAAKANPKRYSSPKQELGNRIATERNAAIGEAETQKAIARKAIERAKIAATPREIKKVDKTLEAAKTFRANKAGARIRRNKTDRGK